MKKLVISVWALFCLALTLNATIITVRLDPLSPLGQKVPGGALLPLLTVGVKASQDFFPPPVYLVVQQTTSTLFAQEEIVESIYIGGQDKVISRGPFKLNDRHQCVVGPIFLEEDWWRTVVISALLLPNLTSANGQKIELDVVGVSVDANQTTPGSVVLFEGNFPIKGAASIVDGFNNAESLTIKNVTSGSDAVLKDGQAVVAEFEVVAKGGDLIITGLPLNFNLGYIPRKLVHSVKILTDEGLSITLPALYPGEDQYTFSAIFRQNILVHSGTNHWSVIAGIDRYLAPETSIVMATVGFFGEVYGPGINYAVLPTIDDRGVIVHVLNPRPFTGTFNLNLTIGSFGYDVQALQRILNSAVDTRVAVSGPGSYGDEGFYFDEATKAAVIVFQQKYGLPETGFVGPLTRTVLNSRTNWLEVKISSVVLTKLPNVNVNARLIALQGVIKPNTSYDVEISTDLKSWEVIGGVSKSSSIVLKEQVGMMDITRFPDKAFFRLVEKL